MSFNLSSNGDPITIALRCPGKPVPTFDSLFGGGISPNSKLNPPWHNLRPFPLVLWLPNVYPPWDLTKIIDFSVQCSTGLWYDSVSVCETHLVHVLSAAITFVLQESSGDLDHLHLDPCLRKWTLTKPLGKWHEPSDGTTGHPLTIWLLPGHNCITGTPRAHSPRAQKFSGESVHHHSDSIVCATSCRADFHPLLSALCSELVWNDLPKLVTAQPAAQPSVDNSVTRMINDILKAGLVPEWSQYSSSATKRKRLDREVLLAAWCVHPDSELWGHSCYPTVQCGMKLWTKPIKQTASADHLPSHSRIDSHAAEPLLCCKKQLLYFFKLEIPHSTCEKKKNQKKIPQQPNQKYSILNIQKRNKCLVIEQI